MKIENGNDVKHVETLINAFNKVNLSGFTGGDAYPIFKALEWMAKSVHEFKSPPPTPKAPSEQSKVTSISTAKNKKNEKK
jgi:hypothetical protein